MCDTKGEKHLTFMGRKFPHHKYISQKSLFFHVFWTKIHDQMVTFLSKNHCFFMFFDKNKWSLYQLFCHDFWTTPKGRKMHSFICDVAGCISARSVGKFWGCGYRREAPENFWAHINRREAPEKFLDLYYPARSAGKIFGPTLSGAKRRKIFEPLFTGAKRRKKFFESKTPPPHFHEIFVEKMVKYQIVGGGVIHLSLVLSISVFDLKVR